MLPGLAGLVGFGAAAAASGPTATAHRYWRIWVGKESDNPSGGAATVIGVAEIEMREAVGGADVTGSGTASADSSFSGFSPSAAFANDNATTEWASAASAFPHWIKYDFGSGVTKAIVEVAIMPRTGLPSQGPGPFKIQSSDDDSTWADEWWVAYTPEGTNSHSYANGTFKVFTKPIVDQSPSASRHRYWRLGITGSNGTSPNFYVGARTIEMRTVSQGPDETEGGTASSTSNFSGLPPANAFDSTDGGTATTEWASNNVGFPEYIKYDFGASHPVFIQEIFYKARAGLESSQAPTGFTIEYSDDNSSWTTVRTVTGITGWTAAGKIYSVP